MEIAELLGYLGPGLILAGSSLAAWNAGARVTGSGFVLIAAGQLAFGSGAFLRGDNFALGAAAILFTINMVGAWRWLHHVARLEAMARATERETRRSRNAPTLTSARLMLGCPVRDTAGDKVGELDDILFEAEADRIAYFVIHHTGRAKGGFIGVQPHLVSAAEDEVRLGCPIAQCPDLPAGTWPAALDGENAGTRPLVRR